MFFNLLARILRAAILVNRTAAALGATALIIITVREHVRRTKLNQPVPPRYSDIEGIARRVSK